MCEGSWFGKGEGEALLQGKGRKGVFMSNENKTVMVSRRQALGLGFGGVGALMLSACGGSGSSDSGSGDSGSAEKDISSSSSL